MKFILFEVYYRIFYTIGAISIIECFSYFVQGHQLEFFSGLLAFNYQAIDFDSYRDLRCIGPRPLSKNLEQEDCFLFFEGFSFCKKGQAENSEDGAFLFKPQRPLNYFENCSVEKQPSDLLALSRNEGRAWFYLFIVLLSYFYCLEVGKTTLHTMLIYIKLINFCILTITNIYSAFIPGLFRKSAANNFFILIAFTVILMSSKIAIFILASSFEELKLEQLDSELL